MTLHPKAQSLIGFAKKSSQLFIGQSAVETGIKKGKVALVLMATDMPEKRMFHLKHWCDDLGIKYLCLGSKEEYGRVLGLSPRGILAISNKQMADSLVSTLDLEN